jgi:diadenosine tetraphosphate (Ap4A) HIT family hydrolase
VLLFTHDRGSGLGRLRIKTPKVAATMEACLACDLTAGRSALPGATIARESGWVVEHCVGPLGVGTLIVKPERHVVHVAHLTESEAAAMGPVLHRAATVVSELSKPDQVYVSLWSHAGRKPGHIHYVVQPVDQQTMRRHDAHGPKLQAAMFDFDDPPDPRGVDEYASRARDAWPD